MVIERLAFESQLAALSPTRMEDTARSTNGRISNARVTWKEISHNVDELGLLVKEKTSTWVKSCRESSERETEAYATSKGMAEDSKVDGVRLFFGRQRAFWEMQRSGKMGFFFGVYKVFWEYKCFFLDANGFFWRTFSNVNGSFF